VDVPGVGFAKVSLDQKAKWAAFFKVGRQKGKEK
jgi:GTP-binding protein EngB required for normal cell division